MNDAPKPATRDPDAAASAADPTLAATSGAAAPVSAASDPAVAAAGCASVGGTYVVAGRYEILGMLGVGGMGTVYRARDRELDEVVALKALRRELVDAPGMLERFRREVKLARRVTHPNVARVFDIGEHDGEKFLTMEYVDGESLAGLLAREGALSVARGVELAVAVCAGLGAAHHAGVVHRDLKPDNVLLSKSGRVVVTDFGIARAVMDGGAGQTAGGLVGTPAYMAPEQVEGAADVDARADVYALGAMLFELFTGARPWIGDAPIAVAAARLVHPPPDPRAKKPDLPTPLARAILRCMARRREERFASVAEVAAELASLTLPAPSAPLSSLPRSSLGPPPSIPSEKASDRTVAVLPFRNLGRPDDDYLADEVTDDLIDGLSMTPRLKVRSRGAMEKYRGKTVDPREVGEELGVQVVVDGSVRKVGGGVRITARLVSVADGFQLWAKRFDRPEQEVLAVNDEVAKAVAAALTLDGARPTRDAPSDPVTIDLYLRARHAYRRFWPQAMEEAVRLFDQVLERAPEDPMVLAGAALANARHAFFTGERRDVAVALGEKAVALGPTLGDAHLALANALFQVGDVERSVRELRQAIAKNPGLAEAHASLGRILLEIGEEEEGRRRVEAAIQLDEQVPLAHAALARMHALRGDWDEVERLYRAAAGHDASQGAWTALTRSAMWRRTLEETNRVLRGLDVELRDGTIPAVVLSIVRDRRFPPNWAEIIGERAGTQSAARSRVFFNQLEAEAHAYLGDDARALDPIERALDAGLIDFAWLERCPLFGDRLRAEPRFVAARERLRERVARIVAAYRAP